MNDVEIVEAIPKLALLQGLVSQVEADRAFGLARDAKALKIVSVEDYQKGGEIMNALGRMRVYLEKQITEARRPHTEHANALSAEGKPFVDVVKAAEAVLNPELMAFKRLQDEEQRKAEQERQRLAEEARQVQAKAEAAIEGAKDSAAFDAAEDLFHQGLAKAEEAKAVVVPPAFKPTGATMKKTPVIESYDLKKLPIEFHEIDEAKTKKAILMGLIDHETPGIKFRIEESFRGTGR